MWLRSRATHLSSLYVLLVEDHRAFARLLATATVERGHACVAVNKVSAAIQAITASTFDVVVTDRCVGIASGLDVLRAVASASPKARRVLMSGSWPEEPDEVGLVHEYLAKPFTLAHFFAAIERTDRVP